MSPANWWVFSAKVTSLHNKKIYPSHHVVKANNNGLSTESIVKCEQIRAIAKSRLQVKIGSLSTLDMKAIDKALKITLDVY